MDWSISVELARRPFVYPPNKQLQQTEGIAKAAFDLTDNKPFKFCSYYRNEF